MATIGNIVLFVLGLSLLIFIHEFGHFIFAKLFKVYCLEFSIGMGPSIISKKFKKDEETTYSIRALPIGGYVSMAGETLDSAENEKELKFILETVFDNLSLTESKTSVRKSIKESADDNWYKLKMLNEMLDAMEEDEYNIPKLGIYDVTKNIDLDEGAIRALIKYYK